MSISRFLFREVDSRFSPFLAVILIQLATTNSVNSRYKLLSEEERWWISEKFWDVDQDCYSEDRRSNGSLESGNSEEETSEEAVSWYNVIESLPSGSLDLYTELRAEIECRPGILILRNARNQTKAPNHALVTPLANYQNWVAWLELELQKPEQIESHKKGERISLERFVFPLNESSMPKGCPLENQFFTLLGHSESQ